MRAIDTNILLRLITADDLPQTTRARQYVQQGAWISHLVLLETIWVLQSAYKYNPTQQQTVITQLLDHEVLVLQDPDTIRAALGLFTATNVGFSDCVILATASRNGHKPLGTFDSACSKLDGAFAV